MALVTIIRRTTEGSDRIYDTVRAALAQSSHKKPLLEDDWVRGSSIGQFCPREEVLCSRGNVLRPDVFDGDAGINFQMGHAIHWMMQSRILAKSGLIVGSWRCTWCGESYGSRATEMIPCPERCIRCGAIAGDAPRSGGRADQDCHPNAFLYQEEFVGNAEWRIGGHPDGYLKTGTETWLLEFKSSNENNFKKYRSAPDFVHVIQTQIYLWLTGLQKGKIIYINKNGGRDTFFHEHDFEYDPDIIDKVQAAVKMVRDGLRGGSVPPRTVCATPDCSRAIGCRVRDVCFKDG